MVFLCKEGLAKGKQTNNEQKQTLEQKQVRRKTRNICTVFKARSAFYDASVDLFLCTIMLKSS